MITVNYMYDIEVVLSYRRMGNEGNEIILPRTNEFVEINNVEYCVEKITHAFQRYAGDSEHEINIELS